MADIKVSPGWFQRLSHRHVHGSLLPVSSCGRPPVCLCPGLSSSEVTGHSGSGPTQVTSF